MDTLQKLEEDVTLQKLEEDVTLQKLEDDVTLQKLEEDVTLQKLEEDVLYALKRRLSYLQSHQKKLQKRLRKQNDPKWKVYEQRLLKRRAILEAEQAERMKRSRGGKLTPRVNVYGEFVRADLRLLDANGKLLYQDAQPLPGTEASAAAAAAPAKPPDGAALPPDVAPKDAAVAPRKPPDDVAAPAGVAVALPGPFGIAAAPEGVAVALSAPADDVAAPAGAGVAIPKPPDDDVSAPPPARNPWDPIPFADFQKRFDWPRGEKCKEEGGYSKFYEANDTENGNVEVALVVSKWKLDKDQLDERRKSKEIQYNCNFRCTKHCAELIAWSYEEVPGEGATVYSVSPLGYTLENFLNIQYKEIGHIPLEHFLFYFRQLVRILQTLEDEGVVHRDIKVANLIVMIDEDDNADSDNADGLDLSSVNLCLIDWDLALKASNFTKDNPAVPVGTPGLMGPGNWFDNFIDSDLPAVALTALEIFVGSRPFSQALAVYLGDLRKKVKEMSDEDFDKLLEAPDLKTKPDGQKHQHGVADDENKVIHAQGLWFLRKCNYAALYPSELTSLFRTDPDIAQLLANMLDFHPPRRVTPKQILQQWPLLKFDESSEYFITCEPESFAPYQEDERKMHMKLCYKIKPEEADAAAAAETDCKTKSIKLWMPLDEPLNPAQLDVQLHELPGRLMLPVSKTLDEIRAWQNTLANLRTASRRHPEDRKSRHMMLLRLAQKELITLKTWATFIESDFDEKKLPPDLQTDYDKLLCPKVVPEDDELGPAEPGVRPPSARFEAGAEKEVTPETFPTEEPPTKASAGAEEISEGDLDEFMRTVRDFGIFESAETATLAEASSSSSEVPMGGAAKESPLLDKRTRKGDASSTH